LELALSSRHLGFIAAKWHLIDNNLDLSHVQPPGLFLNFGPNGPNAEKLVLNFTTMVCKPENSSAVQPLIPYSGGVPRRSPA
jgi:hypothetical protein